MSKEFEEQIDQFIKSKPWAIYMKGSPDFPMCGFSAQTIEALRQVGVKREDLASFDVLENRPLFEVLKKYKNWPTSPQLYHKGELIGGCDIVVEMFQSGELQELVNKAS